MKTTTYKVDYKQSFGGRPDPSVSASDCAIRSICEYFQAPECYDEIFQMTIDIRQQMLNMGCKKIKTFRAEYTPKLHGTPRVVSIAIRQLLGLKKQTPSKRYPTISEAYAEFGDCIIQTRKHVFAIVDGIVRDSYDSRYARHFENGVPTGFRTERKALSIYK